MERVDEVELKGADEVDLRKILSVKLSSDSFLQLVHLTVVHGTVTVTTSELKVMTLVVKNVVSSLDK